MFTKNGMPREDVCFSVVKNKNGQIQMYAKGAKARKSVRILNFSPSTGHSGATAYGQLEALLEQG